MVGGREVRVCEVLLEYTHMEGRDPVYAGPVQSEGFSFIGH